jgi:hypothetical protein
LPPTVSRTAKERIDISTKKKNLSQARYNDERHIVGLQTSAREILDGAEH